MKFALAALFLALLATVSSALPPLERSYNILMLLPVGSKSHKNFLNSVAVALAERGHKVTMLSNYPPFSTHPNITDFNHELTDLEMGDLDIFEARKNPFGGFALLQDILPTVAKKLYKIPEVMALYERRKSFDLIIVDHVINEVAYPFLHDVTYMTIAAFGMDAAHSAVMGNVQHPAYVSGMLHEYPRPMNPLHRFLNALQHIYFPFYWRHWKAVPKIQKEISSLFPNLPPLLEIERNQSLTLINSHFSLDMTLPLLPSQVEIGGIHCRPPKPLPKELDSWIAGAGPEGVIYFSLGSIVEGRTMPDEYRAMFIEAFKRLKHRVIWKYEEGLDGVPDNVLLQKWLPQQDILGHPKVKVFISHAGLLSTQESLYHATPMVVLPIIADEPKNAMRIEEIGLGIALVWEELTVEAIVDSVRRVMTEEKFQRSAQDLSRMMRDQIQTPKERAVFWTEYVIRNRGAPLLRSPATQLSWVEFLMLDVLLAIHVVTFIVFSLLSRAWRALTGKASPSRARRHKMD